MRQETTGTQVGEIPLHGTRGSSARAHRLGQSLRSRQGQDRGHPKPPSTKYCQGPTELSRACRLLSKIYSRFCQSLQAPYYPSLQRQGLHHRRRREAHIHDVEASTDRGTDSTKS